MKVLLIEDTDVYIHTLERVTTILNYELITAETGAEGLKRAGENPDLIIVDLGLPDMDGVELVRELRKRLPTTPIVALTARVLDGERERLLEAGCNDYIAKPVEIPVLIELLKSYAE